MKKIIPLHGNDKTGSITRDKPTHSVNKLHARINPFVRFCSRIWFGLQKTFLLWRLSRPCQEYIDNTPFHCFPDILNLVVFRSVEFLTHIPRWTSLVCCASRQDAMSRKLSRHVSEAKAMQWNWSMLRKVRTLVVPALFADQATNRNHGANTDENLLSKGFFIQWVIQRLLEVSSF